MVSTRGVRYKFSEGERVLCYEPDPTKAKVLYDSKVLEVIESKDKRGRRTVEYLIHFQGWNSSWDRCVSEDFVLKDTEENRQLQRDLAEKSQLQLGAYLYRRERKKGGSASTGAGPAKRARHGFSDDGSSTSTQPDGLFTEGETAGDTDSSMGSGSSSQAPTPPPNANIGRALIALPPVLRDRLTFDYHLVVKRGRLSQLPASPSAADILESFVKWFARSGAWRPARARPDPPHRPDLLDVCCRLNLVREVADGLRVYFDFIIQGHLLYKQEQNQYHEVCGQFVEKLEPIIKTEVEEKPLLEEATMSIVEDNIKSPNEYAHLPPDPVDSEKSEEASGSQSNNIDQTPTEKNKVNSKAGNIKNEVNNKTSSDNKEVNSKTNSDKKEVNSKASSVKNEVSSKTGSDKSEVNSKADGEQNEVKSKTGTDKNENNKSSSDKNEVNNKSSSDKTEVNNKAGSDKSEVNNKGDKPSSSEDNNNKDKGQSKPREPRCATRSGNLARRLRSHKSAVSQSETEEPAPSTSTGEPRETLSSSVGSSGSSISSGWLGQRAVPVAPVATQNTRTPLSLLLDKVAKWQIIPREGTEHLPCRVYGAIHLSRLFVKLPDFLNAMSMPDMKLKLILKHIDMFVQYLEEHNEWFGEMYYVADSSSRSR